MESSIFLARLIGPILVVIGVGMLAQPQGYRAVAEEFLASPALIYIAGLLAFVPGLAIVLTHNVWTSDWRLIITLLGWLATFGGIFRLLMPAQVRRIGTAMLARPGWLRGGAVAVVALGAVLSFFGYLA
jgi:uncharacterized protein YjeT (DUF2065 family)